MEPKYYKARVIETGIIVYVRWSNIAGEYYEKETGEAYQCDEIVLL